jgi:hypothetical protein
MMGSGVRIPLAAPIQVLIDQTGGQGQQLVATTSFSASRGSTGIASRLGSSAVGPCALTVRSPRSRRRNPLPFSDTPGAIDIEAGRWAARPTCHGSPAHPRACASFGRQSGHGPSLPQRANVSPACPASSTHFKLGAKPPIVAGREVGPTTRARTAVLRQRHQYARDPTQAAMSDPIFTR